MKSKNYKKTVIFLTLTIFTLACILTGCHKNTVSLKKESTPTATASAVDVSPGATDVSPEGVKNNEENSGKQNSSNSDTTSQNDSAADNNNNTSQGRAAGKLSVVNGKLVDSGNNPVQLHGVSTHGLSWFPEYVNKAAFKTLRDDWGVDTIRLSMYTAEYNGYCSGGNQGQLKQTVHNGVDYATELGMYVIIDWHILSDGNPNTYINEATAFFQEMASTYAGYDNVIFEICNEPNGGTSWSDVKKYANAILPVIRGAGSNAVVLIGTPTWSQDIHLAANDPVTGFDNIMYTFHFYAATHKGDLQNRFKNAVNSGLPVFVSEFGITDASGNGNIDIESANTWMSIFNSNNISTVCWNLSNKNESSSLIKNSCKKTSGWSYDELSAEGQWLVDTYRGALSSNGSSTVTEDTGNASNNVQNNTQPDSQSVSNENPANQNTTTNNNISNGNGKAEVSCNQINSWNDGNSDYYQYEIVVSNSGDGTLNGWKLNISFSAGIEMNQYWCCNCNLNGSNIEITPVDYNQNLEPGASVNIGFIVKGPSSLQINNTQIN